MSGDRSAELVRDPRVYFAGERTFLAWVRTGLALMGFGFVVARIGLFLRELALMNAPLQEGRAFSLWIGTALILLGAMLTTVAGFRHVGFTRRFERGEDLRIFKSVPMLILSLVIALLGIGLAIHLLTIPN